MKKVIRLINENKELFCSSDSNLLVQKSYEQEIANLFSGKRVNGPFHDIEMPYSASGQSKTLEIELKKGCSFWVNEIKLAKMLLDGNLDVVFIFFQLGMKKKKKYLKKIYILKSVEKLLDVFKITKEHAKYIVSRQKKMKKNLCYQQGLTGGDLSEIADYTIDMCAVEE